MRRKVAYMVVLLVLEVLAISSCRKDPQPVPGPEERIPVLWDVTEVGEMKDTKALVTDQDGLQDACKPVADGGQGKSIGVWADYSIVEGAGDPDASGAPSNGRLETYENVFDNAQIVYTGNTSESTSGWNSAEGKDVYWALGGDYKFRAYYPHSMNEYITSNSDADVFILEYRTGSVQEDLCLAYNTVSTTDNKWDSKAPVQLDMKHAMAAVRFQFQFAKQDDNIVDGKYTGYEDEDWLTACWLENTVKGENAFATQALLVYGDGSDATKIDWSENYQPSVGQKFYMWELKKGDKSDLTLDDTDALEGFKFNNIAGADGKIATQNNAIAYKRPGSDLSLSSLSKDVHVSSDGWILIVPQKSDGTVQLCFKTLKGGNVEYRVTIPKETNDSETEWKPGYRYTYTVSITKTNLGLELTIAPWNKLKSSYDIVL